MSGSTFSDDEQFKEKLKRDYEKLKPLYEDLVEEVLFTLEQCIEHAEIKTHSLTPRETFIKSFESFADKTVRKRIADNFFEAIEDIAGVRVICLYRPDLERIGKLISDSFDIIKSDTARTRTEEPFGYASDHYIVKLSEKCKGPRYDHLRDLKCEIQVRTVLMDAWASVSHHLEYKNELDIPRELRANFNALAGVFYVADTQFQAFRTGIEEARSKLTRTVEQEKYLDQEINLDSLSAYMKWKFPDRQIERVTDASILSELREMGYRTLNQLNNVIDFVRPVLQQLEIESFGLESWKPRWAPVGVIRVCLYLGDDRYFKSRGMPQDARNQFKEYRERLPQDKKPQPLSPDRS